MTLVTPEAVDVTALDGRTFERFVAAGTYFLRKYRGQLNELNVFPVPDGDTGSNMYLTARAALAEAVRTRGQPLSSVAAAVAEGSLLGARGNSGVILSQMLRGFAENVRHEPEVGSVGLALAMREAVGAARSALQKPVEGTMISVASAAADAAYAGARKEPSLARLAVQIVRAAAEALERTPEQLPVLKEAGVVDSGGAGILYFLEGILRFLPGDGARSSAFARKPVRRRAVTAKHAPTTNRFCTEFLLEAYGSDTHALREVLESRGESLIVAGNAPTLRVHLHTAEPQAVLALAGEYGRVSHEKVDDMERQHRLLHVDVPDKPFGIVAVVPGEGFAHMARELGADVAHVAADGRPSVRDLVVAINACLPGRVYLLPNDGDVILAANEAAAIAEREVVVVPTRDVPTGFSVLLGLATQESAAPDTQALLRDASIQVGTVFFAGKDATLGGTSLSRGAPAASVNRRLLTAETLTDVILRATAELGARPGALVTLYYGGSQTLADARAVAAVLASAFEGSDVQYYHGGQRSSEYVISSER